MFIPPWQEMINQSQEIPETMMTQRFFSEVHLLANKLVPIVAIHSLGGTTID
jgi:hypothetical protein